MNAKPVLFIALSLLLAFTAIPVQAKPLKGTLVIAISHDFHPFTFVNTEGKPAGMFVDIWRLWAKKSGKKIEFISSDWKTSLENLKTGKADIHSGLILSPLRSSWMSETRSMYGAGIRYFHPLGQGGLGDFGKLAGETVAVVRGAEPEEYLQRQHPDIRVLSCQTREELLRVTRAGMAKGFLLLEPVGSALIDRHGLTGEFEKNGAVLYREDFHPGVLKERRELAAYVDKGLSAISHAEFEAIEARWIADPAKRYFTHAGRVNLTPAQQLWLNNHQTIRVGMSPVLPPLKFTENGIIKGVEPDYLAEIAERTGLKFQLVTCPFSEMDAKVKAGELDMFLSFDVPERLGYMTFTQPFMDFKQVVIARNDAPFIGSVAALQGKRVATIRGVKLHDKILAPFPNIRTVPCDNLEQAFRAVSGSKADAILSKTLFAGQLMSKYPDLKIAGVLDLPPEPYLYAVRKDYSQLVGILNKAIASIPREKHEAIQQKWLTVRLEHRPNWSEILQLVYLVGAGFIAVLVVSLYWNRRLQRAQVLQMEMDFELREDKAMEQRQQELAELRRLVEEEERSRLARELHDGTGQSLQAIRLHLKLMADGKGEGNPREELNMLAQEIADTASELRDLSHQLRPSYLEDVTLDKAIFSRCDMLIRRGVPVAADCYGDCSHIPADVSDNLYRIFQEALANACRHASARHIKVYLNRNAGSLRLIVSDDGCGIEPDRQGDGMGLRIMSERAALIGASLDITSASTGTTVAVSLEET